MLNHIMQPRNLNVKTTAAKIAWYLIGKEFPFARNASASCVLCSFSLTLMPLLDGLREQKHYIYIPASTQMFPGITCAARDMTSMKKHEVPSISRQCNQSTRIHYTLDKHAEYKNDPQFVRSYNVCCVQPASKHQNA